MVAERVASAGSDITMERGKLGGSKWVPPRRSNYPRTVSLTVMS